MTDREQEAISDGAQMLLAAWDNAATPSGSGVHDGGGFALTNWQLIRATFRALAAHRSAEPDEDAAERAITKAYNAVTGQDNDEWNPDKTLDALRELWVTARTPHGTEPDEDNWEYEVTTSGAPDSGIRPSRRFSTEDEAQDFATKASSPLIYRRRPGIAPGPWEPVTPRGEKP